MNSVPQVSEAERLHFWRIRRIVRTHLLASATLAVGVCIATVAFALPWWGTTLLGVGVFMLSYPLAANLITEVGTAHAAFYASRQSPGPEIVMPIGTKVN